MLFRINLSYPISLGCLTALNPHIIFTPTCSIHNWLPTSCCYYMKYKSRDTYLCFYKAFASVLCLPAYAGCFVEAPIPLEQCWLYKAHLIIIICCKRTFRKIKCTGKMLQSLVTPLSQDQQGILGGPKGEMGTIKSNPQPRVPSTVGMLQLHRTKLGHFLYQSKSGNLFPKSKKNKKKSKSYSFGRNCSLFPWQKSVLETKPTILLNIGKKNWSLFFSVL